jgi:hypothetical protein
MKLTRNSHNQLKKSRFLAYLNSTQSTLLAIEKSFTTLVIFLLI